MHPKHGQLRAYLDGETDEAQTARLEQHLEDCPACQRQLSRLAEQASGARARLASLEAQPAAPVRLAAARARFDSYRTQKENTTMFNKIFARRWRPAWIAAALVLILGISLTFPPVQALATSFLGLFRVQTVTVLEVDTEKLPDGLGNYKQFDSFFAENVQVTVEGEPVVVADAAEASRVAGYPVRLPETPSSDELRLTVSPGGMVTMTVDLPSVRAILEEIGRPDITLPDDLDKAVIVVNVPAQVSAEYGDCGYNLDAVRPEGYDPDDPDTYAYVEKGDCTVFVQMPSPTISAPPGLDINAMGEAYLQMLGLSPEEAREYSQNVDWATTLVIPVPAGMADYRTISVDGATATLLVNDYGPQYSEYVLVWVKDGILHGLTGQGDPSVAIALAESLR
jgi:hypothetical protein